MPIVRKYQPDFGLAALIAQLAGEGQYRAEVLNPLATSDYARNQQNQQFQQSLGEQQRQFNLGQTATTNRQIMSQQAQAQQAALNRVAGERMAVFRNLANQQAQSRDAKIRANLMRLQNNLHAQRQQQEYLRAQQMQQQFQQEMGPVAEAYLQPQSFTMGQPTNPVLQGMGSAPMPSLAWQKKIQAEQQYDYTPFQSERIKQIEAKRDKYFELAQDDKINQQMAARYIQNLNGELARIHPTQERLTPIERIKKEGAELEGYGFVAPDGKGSYKIFQKQQDKQAIEEAKIAKESEKRWYDWSNKRADAARDYRSKVEKLEDSEGGEKIIPIYTEEEIQDFLARDFPLPPGEPPAQYAPIVKDMRVDPKFRNFEGRYGDSYNAQPSAPPQPQQAPEMASLATSLDAVSIALTKGDEFVSRAMNIMGSSIPQAREDLRFARTVIQRSPLEWTAQEKEEWRKRYPRIYAYMKFLEGR